MTREGRLSRGKQNYESGRKRLMKNPETLEYLESIKKLETPAPLMLAKHTESEKKNVKSLTR